MSDHPAALVVRGATPVGQAAGRRLAEAGFEMAVTYEQDQEAARAVADHAVDRGHEAVTLPGRVGDPMAAGSLVDHAAREIGPLDALVLAPQAGPVEEPTAASPSRAFVDVDLAGLEPALQAGLKGPLVVLQAAAERMLDAGGGRAVLVAPQGAADAGPAGASPRLAAAALASLVELAGDALAPDVAVNGVLPGPLVPDGVDPDDLEGADGLVTADEVARVAVHLAEGPDALTGQTVRVGSGPGPARGSTGTAPGEGRELAGIEQRIQPPDPGDRIDLE